MLTYMFAFIGTKDNQWLFIIVLLIISFCSFYNYRMKWPFYKDAMTLYMSCLTGIFVWGNINILLGKILENTGFESLF
jgi:hypothetical protein